MPAEPGDGSSFTGVNRSRKTRLSVKLGDIFARIFITIGGIGTIAAVTLICVFLIWVITPLFTGGDLETKVSNTWQADTNKAPVRVVIDDYKRMVWTLSENGEVDVVRLSNATRLGRALLSPTAKPTAFSVDVPGRSVAVGTEAGEFKLGEVYFANQIIDRTKAPEELRNIEAGEVAELTGEQAGVATVTPKDQIRIQRLAVSFEDPVQLTDGVAITKIAHSVTTGGPVAVVLLADGSAFVVKVEKSTSMLTGIEKTELKKKPLQLTLPADRGAPDHMLMNIQGSLVYCVWNDGFLQRYNIRDLPTPKLVEERDLLPVESERISTLQWLLGASTLLVGTDTGRIDAWFPARPETAESEDGQKLLLGHVIPGPNSPVTSIQSSSRSRLFVSGHQDGDVVLSHVTAESRVAQTKLPAGGPVLNVAISPKTDSVLAITKNGYQYFGFDAEHPDISLKALFGKVHYEGWAEPAHAWQSSSGSDDAEAKLGLWPVVFGTIKATIYSLLFGVPIALLAAIYTSEFLHPKIKARVKPTIELMASLPSVVLGFLAGLVFAPYVESTLPAMLAMPFTIPFALLVAAFLWQMMPQRIYLQYQSMRFPIMLVVIFIGVALGFVAGPLLIEGLLFGGDIKRWLSDREFGSVAGGWTLLLLPVIAVIVAFFFSRVVTPKIKEIGADWDRGKMAGVDLVKFIVSVVITIGITFAVAWVFGLMGDARESKPAAGDGIFGTYVSRNALVVGFAMGFAIIPIIYTIAEDALSSVPEHLRGASLGAGATPWQTATRIIIPTAMSGLFSAVMVGLGRAVGETMIVLMAAGNTPVLDWSPFNGFRTLSGNIAEEMPEAAKDSTHFRTLFLCALVLFILTFLLNTAAEFVRQRFRKKAYQL